MVNLHRFLNGVGSCFSRVQRGIRILKDHLDVPAGCLTLVDRQIPEILAIVGDRSGGWLVELYKTASKCGFAASGLTDDAKGFTLINIKRNIAQCVEKLTLFPYFFSADHKILTEMIDAHDYIFLHVTFTSPRVNLCSPSCLWHATKCPGATSLSGGTCCLQISVA